MPSSKHKEYYVVIEGFHLERPMIFSSWAKVHLRVTGYKHDRKTIFRGFSALQEAKDFMSKAGITDYGLDVASEHESTRPVKGTPAYYAVAYGKRPGIYEYYDSDSGPKLRDSGAKLEVDHVSGNCHKHFRTKTQAETFIKEWNNLFLEMVVALYEEQFAQVTRHNVVGAEYAALYWPFHAEDATRNGGGPALRKSNFNNVSFEQQKC